MAQLRVMEESIVKQLLNTLPQVGQVRWIGLSPQRKKPLVSVQSAQLIATTGLEGDHHGMTGKSKRQVTLIQAEHLEVLGKLLDESSIEPGRLRRNLVVAGINIFALKGQRFRLGTAVLEGTGPCDPCSRMEAELGTGGYNAMRGHGGICARVLESGEVNVGDAVELVL